MNKLIKTFRDIFSIEDLRERILNTLLFLAVYRLGSYIVLPGVDGGRMLQNENNAEGIFGLLNTLLGGAFNNASIFGLSIMPYISASIVLQLLTVAVPYFQKLQKEGESGRKKINQYTRVLTIGICLAQSAAYIASNIPAEFIYPEFQGTLFNVSSMIILTAGTVFCMWMGEKITDRGIGNGISLLIMVGIISRFPGALMNEARTQGVNGALIFILELFVLFFCGHGRGYHYPGCEANSHSVCKANHWKQSVRRSAPVFADQGQFCWCYAHHFCSVADVYSGFHCRLVQGVK